MSHGRLQWALPCWFARNVAKCENTNQNKICGINSNDQILSWGVLPADWGVSNLIQIFEVQYPQCSGQDDVDDVVGYSRSPAQASIATVLSRAKGLLKPVLCQPEEPLSRWSLLASLMLSSSYLRFGQGGANSSIAVAYCLLYHQR